MLKHGLGALGVGLRLIADGLEAVDAVLERRVVQVGDARLDGVVEALEARFGLRRTAMYSRWRSDRSYRWSRTVARIVSSRSGWSRRSSRWLATRSSRFSIGTAMPSQAAGPCRALVEQA